ncbi:hypothetical protein SSX86_026696 [Deinandra increscens subsp. villosa]|uniref:Deoxyhypusine synthase n=1 Tax=Deinandra increscens subsp. villosa TaxID=3103831 RepID=A0AAP0CGE4_9ASTR
MREEVCCTTKVMENLRAAVFKKSQSLEEEEEEGASSAIKIQGYDFMIQRLNHSQLLQSFGSTGFQASHLNHAIRIVNEMLEWRLSHEQVTEDCSEEEKNPLLTESLARGLSRIGNILVPDESYRKLEDWIFPVFDQMLEEQITQHVLWTPSKVIARLGKEINDESSCLYWAYKNDIPVFCPDMMVDSFANLLDLHSLRNPGLPDLYIGVQEDFKAMKNEAVNASPRKTGMIILGGGTPKRHICNANMCRNGADYAVFINAAQEFDGSDSGASPEEAVSRRQIRLSAKYVKVHGDPTISFLFLVAETFAATMAKPTKSNLGEATKDGKVNENVRSTKESQSLECARTKIRGYEFNQGVNYSEMYKSLIASGFQATNLGGAIETVNQMLDWRLSHEPVTEDCSEEEKNPTYRESVKCKIFLGFTSNLISSGVRDIIRYLVQCRMVDVIVTTTGGIEEDIIKCLADTYEGDFSLPGAALRSKGLNRIGNLLVPNDNYCKFEDWVVPIFDKMLEEQKNQHVSCTPSKLIARLGKEINDERSYIYWAYKNDIPVFCPGLTDGSLGDMLYFHSFRSPGLTVDVVQDIKAMNGEAVYASPRKTGMIILGGGLPKHHICNANMMRNGADYAVFINTAQEFDGSDSGARPDEAISWGKIRASAKYVKVHSDATIAFPLLVAETFAAARDRTAEPKPSS